MKLKLIYAIHMLAPMSFVYWHIERLQPDTIRALARAFPVLTGAS